MIKKITFLMIFVPLLSSSNYVDVLKVPKNFEISIFAENLNSPRQITETSSGHIVVGSKKGNEVIALIDKDNDGIFEDKIVVANICRIQLESHTLKEICILLRWILYGL